MHKLIAAAGLCLCLTGTAAAFDADIQALIDKQKSGKVLTNGHVAQLMMGSAIWCYAEDGDTCSWTDIYLSAGETGALVEVSNAISDGVDIAYQQEGYFEDKTLFCETPGSWISTIWAKNRADNTSIGGRALAQIKIDVEAALVGDTDDCFDYLYRSSDADAQTIVLTQRQYKQGEHQDSMDVMVTLHFDPAAATRLTQRW